MMQMDRPDFERAKQYVFSRLENGLASDLYYHNLQHTRDDVLPAATRLAAMEGVGGEDLLLLRTAALYHDTGFLEQYLEHEAISARIASETLPCFGYNPAQIQGVARIILATRLLQTPETLLHALICDADLDLLGREDFLTLNHKLRLELSAYSQPTTDRTWYTNQLRFLEEHAYFTAAAKSLREAGKQKNIEALKELLIAEE